MYIILVEHRENGQRYLFDCTNLKDVVKMGDTVICQTIQGHCTGKAVTSPIRVEAGDASLASLFKLCGAYLPIKQIIGVQRKSELSEEEKERIAKEWLRARLGDEDLPF